ncbi:MAG: OmpH family outer membrane protein [Cyanobacteria bacterium]|nr:OmpH family outer membrane protein [Cyanobacteriota bacterium]MDA1021404.1 OmpH family outer membrane protein [Cyanobacteriota bacterium]
MKILILLIVISLTTSPCLAKIASLDIVEIYKSYSLVQEANQDVDKAEASFKRILATAQEEILALEAQTGKEQELETKRQEIQKVVDQRVEALQDSKDFYNTQINRNIARLLETFAKENKLDLIVEKGYIMSPIDDITAEFIKRLEKDLTTTKK